MLTRDTWGVDSVLPIIPVMLLKTENGHSGEATLNYVKTANTISKYVACSKVRPKDMAHGLISIFLMVFQIILSNRLL